MEWIVLVFALSLIWVCVMKMGKKLCVAWLDYKEKNKKLKKTGASVEEEDETLWEYFSATEGEEKS